MFRYFVLGFISALVWGYHVFDQQTWQVAAIAVSLFLAGWGSLRHIFRHYPARSTSLPAGHGQQFMQIIIQVFSGALVAFLCLFFEQLMMPNLPDRAYYHPVEITGQIVGLPQVGHSLHHQPKVSFYLQIDALKSIDSPSVTPPAWQIFKPRIKLSWYRYQAVPKAGDTWRFHVKLKRNHASLNPGGFDYETYLFERHIAATGYVLNRSKPSATKLASASWPSLRANLAAHLGPIFSGREFEGIYRALIYGDKSHLTPQQWTLLQKTGTIHLMAISGLHIGILSTIGFFLFAFIWRMGVRYTNWH
ncbi:MAG: ComEC/Rec2 family competence protein, partial [Hydrogenovibrio sp.]|nr:ComEC/Rec2 family competence protein [Hydrogenovibrio sp.]